MRIRDRMRISGFFVLSWNGDIEIYPNVVVDDGLKRVGDILIGAETSNVTLTKFGAGSGTTNVSYTDSALEGELGKVSPQVTNYPRRKDTVIENAWVVGTSDLNGSWGNIGVFFDDNTMFAHANVTPRLKNSSDQVSVWYFIDLIN